jgi:neuralized-like protein 4
MLDNNESEENNEIVSVRNEDCDYLKLLIGFKRTLMLPELYFLNDSLPSCFCESCCMPNSPLKSWVRFAINQQVTNLHQHQQQHEYQNESFITAYCATRVDKIRSVLDHGKAAPNAEIEQFLMRSSNNNQGDSSEMEELINGKYIILRSQPDNKDKIDKPFMHRYMNNGILYRIYTAFEVKAKLSAIKNLEVNSSHNCKIYTTKEVDASSLILTGLCICLVPI